MPIFDDYYHYTAEHDPLLCLRCNPSTHNGRGCRLGCEHYPTEEPPPRLQDVHPDVIADDAQDLCSHLATPPPQPL